MQLYITLIINMLIKDVIDSIIINQKPLLL
jgi:hypothetical protein